jgi:ribosomal protein S18 acetylase RimI-like enzyme
MEIKRNDVDALPAFAALNIAWIEDLHFVEASDQYMADHPEIYIQGNNSVFSIHIDGEVAGVCALKQDDDGAYELTKMAVDPKFQGRGLGKILMIEVERYAKDELGLKQIYLLSNTVNAAAIRLYKRFGWTVMFEGPHPMYARCNIGMEKQL